MGGTSLKESFASRGSRWNFVRTATGEASGGLLRPILKNGCLAASRVGMLVVTVLVCEVLEPFFSLRLHPNPSLRECVYRLR